MKISIWKNEYEVRKLLKSCSLRRNWVVGVNGDVDIAPIEVTFFKSDDSIFHRLEK